ncbi:nucleotidyltransferase domain-containing protein [Thermococcus sp. M36]|uniref:nucleotidyltransferase domain-containing protein n=1 Tax=Thermococcus sp. M36 TaxID=1638261 RepID=UPI001F0E6161|nr:nucleotidyltransferase domain-containing protein [Thermococcus sp. M36]
MEIFLKEWKEKDFVEAALLTGSHATGMETVHSDVDVYIILSEDVRWRERGNKVIDGVLIEYFANPPRQIKHYFEKEHEEGSRCTARIVAIGKVLFDKTGITEELKKEALEYMRKPFERPDGVWVEIAKYGLWDHLDSVKDAKERNDPSFSHLYHIAINETLRIYSKFLCVEGPPASKAYRLFTEEGFRKAYLFEPFPDERFVELFLKAMRNEEVEALEELISHVFEKMGGFDIDGWRLRTKTEV